MDVVPNLPKCPVPVLMLYRNCLSVRYRYESLHRYRWYRYPCRTEVTEMFGTGIYVVPKLPKRPVPALMYRTYRSIRYRYGCRTEVIEVSGTGIDVEPKLPKYPVPYSCRTELTKVSATGRTDPTEVSGTGNTGDTTPCVPDKTHPSLYGVQKVPFE